MTRPQSHQSHLEPQALIAYLEDRGKWLTGPPDFPRRVVRTLVPTRGRPLLRRLLTRVVSPNARRHAATLATTREPLRLNLGSAGAHLPGWVNVDLLGDRTDLAWDLTRPLPFRQGSVEAIFHEHVLEHFELPAALTLLRESHRLLAPNGILRVGVPDAGAYLQAYGDRNSPFLQAARPGRPTSMLAVQEVFLDHGHRSAYDFETLKLLLITSGFHSVERRPFGDSELRPCPDGEHRRLETLYVEARR
jgi:predicted SAM-dependent methyltransferase